jgi:hypothetical protein
LKTQLLEFVVAVSAAKLRQSKSHILCRLRSIRSWPDARCDVRGWLRTAVVLFDHCATNSINQSMPTSNRPALEDSCLFSTKNGARGGVAIFGGEKNKDTLPHISGRDSTVRHLDGRQSWPDQVQSFGQWGACPLLYAARVLIGLAYLPSQDLADIALHGFELCRQLYIEITFPG